jgi:phosphoserine phosphatase RsbU/P
MKHKYKILVADDSVSYFEIINQIFKIFSDNYELLYAADGKQAVDIALEQKPDLILMDIIMPAINGIEAVKILRQHEKTENTPIIVLSATESLQSAYEAGANDFISKPFNQYELLIKVRSAINLVSTLKEVQEQKSELERQNHELITQRDQISQQRKDILDDIQYSKRIQSAILPDVEYIAGLFPEHFIVNMPRNIVSGDFYWAGEMPGKKIIAVADCTGHGISGAFMTMAGTTFLNEIIDKNIVQKPNDILDKLRKEVIKLLKQKGVEGEAADGMDISLVVIDNEYNMLEFAGANNPLYYIKNDELEIIKGDRMPIGIHLNFNNPFTNHTIDIKKGDIVYLFSDGYADQFGGPRGKKFRYKQFQELILSIYKKPMADQRSILEKTILDWKGDELQVDDIMILGFRI